MVVVAVAGNDHGSLMRSLYCKCMMKCMCEQCFFEGSELDVSRCFPSCSVA